MHSHELTTGRTFGVTFEHGEDFFRTLAEFCRTNGIASKGSLIKLSTLSVEAGQPHVRRLVTSARISLNHRYQLAHPDEDLPPPSEMD